MSFGINVVFVSFFGLCRFFEIFVFSCEILDESLENSGKKSISLEFLVVFRAFEFLRDELCIPS